MSTLSAEPTVLAAPRAILPPRMTRPIWVDDPTMGQNIGYKQRPLPKEYQALEHGWKTRTCTSTRSLPFASHTMPSEPGSRARGQWSSVADDLYDEFGDFGFSRLHEIPVISPPPSPTLVAARLGDSKKKTKNAIFSPKSGLASVQRSFASKNKSTSDLLSGSTEDEEKGARKEAVKEKMKGLMKHFRASSKDGKPEKKSKAPEPCRPVEIIRVPTDAFSPTQTFCSQDYTGYDTDMESSKSTGASLKRRPRTQTKTSGRGSCSGRNVRTAEASLRRN